MNIYCSSLYLLDFEIIGSGGGAGAEHSVFWCGCRSSVSMSIGIGRSKLMEATSCSELGVIFVTR